ncbi:chromosome segregation ATPase [Crossiella equi]|uniref:Chromosome segregation ATPase n=1 Tax=Crossiella equi TaxID=130796 RepID=A0ABS5AEN1_9PSEU|nr:apolipoprotein A1/A4/E family protein [Crossiella equi]MBP2474707.1 chromosome segregation ATPase [Crossiella equi]
MRSTLMRAAEIRESEQQQIFDALDEIHARLSPLESIGSVRKRLSELPDRTEVSVLAERLDETLARLEAQDGAIAGLGRAVESLVDKLAKPFAQLDGRLDGVAGRFEGVQGKMDGLEDKLSNIHKRLDDLGGNVERHLDKQDARLESLPAAITSPVRERIEALETVLRGRIDEVDEGVHEHLDGTREALQRSLGESTDTLRGLISEGTDSLRGAITEGNTTLRGAITDGNNSLRTSITEGNNALRNTVNDGNNSLHNALAAARDEQSAAREEQNEKLDDLLSRPAVDPTDRLQGLAERLEALNARLEQVGGRLDSVEDNVTGRLGDLDGSVKQGLNRVSGTVSERPDNDALLGLVRQANEESDRRHAGQLDEAMATFAELILGGGAPTPPPPPAVMPRQQRRSRAKSTGKSRDAEKSVDPDGVDADIES